MICLFGGTFDPIHNGHLHAASAVCDELNLPAINLVLSARPSHRGGLIADITQRWEMLQLACADYPRMVPDDREVRRQAPSYTVDTLAQVRAEHPDALISWVIGSDAYALLQSWYQWQRVVEFANLVVLKRPGYPLELDTAMQEFTEQRTVRSLGEHDAGEVLILEHGMLPVSAREIRRIVASGGAPDHLLPAAVANYIRRYDLYGVIGDPRSIE